MLWGRVWHAAGSVRELGVPRVVLEWRGGWGALEWRRRRALAAAEARARGKARRGALLEPAMHEIVAEKQGGDEGHGGGDVWLKSLIFLAFWPHIVGWISKDRKDLPPSRTYDFHRIRLSTEFYRDLSMRSSMEFCLLTLNWVSVSLLFPLGSEILYFPYPYDRVLRFPK